MSKTRRLYLQNASGERIGLNGENAVYAAALAGLGYTLSPSFADLKNGFFREISDGSEPQSTPAYSLYFTGAEPYKDYQDFVNWLAAAGTLELIYRPFGEKEYRRQVSINYLSKGEKNEMGWLEIPAAFFAVSQWYRPQPTELSLDAGESTAMRFDLVFDDDLRFGTDSAAAFSGTIAGSGHVPGAVLFRYYGEITNPRISLVGNLSGETFGICSVQAALEPGEALELSTVYTDSHLVKIAVDGSRIDLQDAIDLATDPYFHVPVNEPCTISMEADSPFSGSAELLVYYYFRSV